MSGQPVWQRHAGKPMVPCSGCCLQQMLFRLRESGTLRGARKRPQWPLSPEVVGSSGGPKPWEMGVIANWELSVLCERRWWPSTWGECWPVGVRAHRASWAYFLKKTLKCVLGCVRHKEIHWFLNVGIALIEVWMLGSVTECNCRPGPAQRLLTGDCNSLLFQSTQGETEAQSIVNAQPGV